jgi:ribosomal protein L14E/L6E/L27E
MLYTHKIIDESMYNKIEEVKNYVFQHEDRSIRYSSDQAQEAERIINNALDCVKFLKTKYDTR